MPHIDDELAQSIIKDALNRNNREDLLKEVALAAEAFLDTPCMCSTIQDQGAICKSCLLKEAFKGLDTVYMWNYKDTNKRKKLDSDTYEVFPILKK